MDSNSALVKSITLMYLAQKNKDTNYDVRELVKRVIKLIKPTDKDFKTDNLYDLTDNLRDCVVSMYAEYNTGTYNEDDLDQRFKLACVEDERIYQILHGVLIFNDDDIDTVRINKRIASEYWNIRRILDLNSLVEYTYSLHKKIAYQPEEVEWDTFLNDVQTSMSEFAALYSNVSGIMQDNAILDRVEFNDIESIKSTLTRSLDLLSGDGILKIGYKGITRMLGVFGGFRRGEFITFGALKHSYKSGFSRDMFIQIPFLNIPYMLDPSKKPLNLRLSFEDSTDIDILQTYKRLKATLDKEYVDITTISRDEATIENIAGYVYDRLSVNGYHNVILHINPDEFSFEKIVAIIEYYESIGYEIHHLNIDYYAMIEKGKSFNVGDFSNRLQYALTRLKSLAYKKKICVTTPIQLSGEAERLRTANPRGFLNNIADKSMYDGSKKLGQEIDTEIYFNVTEYNGDIYLSYQRGKHRGVDNTPVSHRRGAYLFDRLLGIPMDIYTEDQSYDKVGGERIQNPANDNTYTSDDEWLLKSG